ncbi:MAG: hypothetical protein HOJ90_10765 [Alphaproteobacteria bacterium]|nr:hypothetical protein [Alphaproteobacteria bacterium]
MRTTSMTKATRGIDQSGHRILIAGAAGGIVDTADLAGQSVRIGGSLTPVNIVKTVDGTIHTVDAKTGHDYGTMHDSSTGFGWSLDG